MPAEARAVAELEQLVRLIEQSGLSERRPELRALVDASRQAIGPAPVPRPARRPPVRGAALGRPSAAKAGGKLVTLLRLGADSALALSLLGWFAGWPVLPAGLGLGPEAVPLAAAVLWVALRLEAVADWGYEAGFRLLRGAGFVWLWFAEAFSDAALRRYAAWLAAADVMEAWRAHRRGLLTRPGLPEVEAFLATTYGGAAALGFRRAVAAMLAPRAASTGPLRGLGMGGPSRRTVARVQRLRHSALIRLFEAVAASGVFWVAAEPAPAPPPPPPPPPEPPPEPSAEDAAAAANRRRRADELRDAIKRKRQDVTTAYGWKMKTPAEIAQREQYVDEVKAEIAQLEAELREVLAGPVAVARR